MASQNRQERHLMRQRGAGARNVVDTDFGLHFGVGGSRQDRLQQRQRGAANRKVDNVDFGFSFRTPAGSARSSSRASNFSLRSIRQQSKTPGNGSRESSIARSRRSASRTSATDATKRASKEKSTHSTADDAQPAKKRRLTAYAAEEEEETYPDEPSHARRTSRRKPSSMFAIAEAADEEDPQNRQGINDENRDSPVLSGDLTSMLDQDNEKENVVPGDGKAPPKRKKRKSVGQQSLRKKRRPADGSAAARLAPMDERSAIPTPTSGFPEPAEDSTHEAESDADSTHGEPEQTVTDRSKLPAKRRKKRKSVILVKKKRRSSEGVKSRSRSTAAPKGPTPSQDDDGEDEPRSASALRRIVHRPSPVSRSSPVIRSIEVDDGSDEEYIDEEYSPEPPTPAPAKKGTKAMTAHKAPVESSSRKSVQAKGRRRKSTFPILTHRMTNIDALPTIREEDNNRDSDDGDEASAAVQSFSDRAAPNVADVLGQICRETVETTIDRMETDDGGESKAVRQRKRSALEAFAADLDGRLHEVSAAVEDRLDLEGRVRKVKREKTDLQARWIEVRKQRERVALRCDRLRREHWENEQSREDRWRISEAARKAELDLDRNMSEEEEALEYLLRSVAEEVTNAHDGGLLERMKSMNAQLEHMAGVFEGRAG